MDKFKSIGGVYLTRDIMAIYRCGINEIARLQKLKVIPEEIAPGQMRKRRWSRAVVNRSLGFPVHVDLSVEDVEADLAEAN